MRTRPALPPVRALAASAVLALFVGIGPVHAAGTPTLVLDINATSIIVSSFPTELVAIGSTVYFRADSSEFGKELWKSDGTAAGTMLVKDFAISNSSNQALPRAALRRTRETTVCQIHSVKRHEFTTLP